MRDELATHKRLLSRYCKFIDELHPMYQVLSWEQVAYVRNQQGDTQEYVAIRARVLRQDLQLIRLTFGCGWDQPAKYRRKVRVAVRNLLVGNVLGTSLEVTQHWVRDGKFELIVHVPRPPRVDSEIRLLVAMDWPRKCAPLMAEEVADHFAFKFVNQDVRYVSYRVVLPAGYEAYHEPIGFGYGDDNFRLVTTRSQGGQQEFLFEAFCLLIQRRAGIRLELKGKDTHALRRLAMSISSS